MKVYMMTDYEGVAGIWNWDRRNEESADNHEERMRGRRLLTGEVNAAVEGFLAGGATEVIVNDGHGAGYTIDIESVHEKAVVIHGRDRPEWLPLLDESYAATAVVGAHAKYGTPRGNLRHSQSGGLRYTINDFELGEIGMQALIAGHHGVPFAFLSGDLHACREIEGFIPGVVTAAVKEGLSTLSTATLAPAAARALICEKAEVAMGCIGEIQPFDLGTPVTMIEERLTDTETDEKVAVVRRREITGANILDVFAEAFGFPREAG